jgi:uncharacterized membrane protein YjjP (DUF1212 family)
MTAQATPQTDPRARARALVIRIARGLHQSGVPSGELEPIIDRLGEALGMRAEAMVMPTSVLIHWGEEAAAPGLLRLPLGRLDLLAREQLMAVVEGLEARALSVEEAERRLKAVEEKPPRYGHGLVQVGYVLAAGSSAVLFGGGALDVAAATALGAVVGLGTHALEVHGEGSLWGEAVLAALVTVLAMALATGLELTTGLVVLSALVTLLPGFSLTVSLQELAAGHLVSGSSRLAAAVTTLVALGCGVALGGSAGNALGLHVLGGVARSLPQWAAWVSLPVAAGAFLLLLQIRASRFWALAVTAALSTGLGEVLGAEYGQIVGAFTGALALGLACALIERLGEHPAPSLMVPGLMMLVPGSVGFRGVQAWLSGDALVGLQGFFEMALGAAALAVGLWVAQQVALRQRQAHSAKVTALATKLASSAQPSLVPSPSMSASCEAAPPRTAES